MYSHSTLCFNNNLSTEKHGCLVLQGCAIDFMQLVQIDILVSLGKYLRTHLKDHTGYGLGPRIHSKPKKALLLVSSASWMPESMGKWSVGVECKHSVTMYKTSFKTLSLR